MVTLVTRTSAAKGSRRRFWLAMSGLLALVLLPFSYKVERRLETAVQQLAGDWNWWLLGLYGARAMPTAELGR